MKHNINDDNLKKLFQDGLPEAPNSQWFTRKVINRLPRRHNSHAEIIEYCGFIVATIILGAFWFMSIKSSIGRSITVGDLLNYAIMTAMTIGLTTGFLISHVKKG